MIQSVDRAIRILKTLSGGTGRLGVSELSARLGLAKGTVHGLRAPSSPRPRRAAR